jgi:hypothetical protein
MWKNDTNPQKIIQKNIGSSISGEYEIFFQLKK